MFGARNWSHWKLTFPSPFFPGSQLNLITDVLHCAITQSVVPAREWWEARSGLFLLVAVTPVGLTVKLEHRQTWTTTQRNRRNRVHCSSHAAGHCAPGKHSSGSVWQRKLHHINTLEQDQTVLKWTDAGHFTSLQQPSTSLWQRWGKTLHSVGLWRNCAAPPGLLFCSASLTHHPTRKVLYVLATDQLQKPPWVLWGGGGWQEWGVSAEGRIWS